MTCQQSTLTVEQSVCCVLCAVFCVLAVDINRCQLHFAGSLHVLIGFTSNTSQRYCIGPTSSGVWVVLIS